MVSPMAKGLADKKARAAATAAKLAAKRAARNRPPDASPPVGTQPSTPTDSAIPKSQHQGAMASALDISRQATESARTGNIHNAVRLQKSAEDVARSTIGLPPLKKSDRGRVVKDCKMKDHGSMADALNKSRPKS